LIGASAKARGMIENMIVIIMNTYDEKEALCLKQIALSFFNL
jgi:hypothetical protein